jgi:trigger factor
MKVEVESTSPVERRVSVEIPWEVVRGELDEAYRSLAKRAKVKGFRAGKVPRKVLEQYYRTTVEGEVVNRLVDDGFRRAVEEKDLFPIDRPRLDSVPTVETDAPLRFAAVVEVKPEVEADNWKGLAVERRLAPVTDEAVEQELLQLREKAVVVDQVEDRTDAQMGDLAVIDFFGYLDGEPFKGGKGINYSIELGSGQMIPGFEEEIVGMNIGDHKAFEITFPDDYGNEELKGQTVEFKIDLKELKTKVYPELDDEFAKDLGEFDSLDELREKVRENLATREEAKAKRGLKEAVLERLVEAHSVDVPGSMVERQLSLTLQDAERAVQNADDPKIRDAIAKLRVELRPQAERQVAGMLLLEGIARSEQLEVTDEELDARIQELAQEHRMTAKQVKQQLRQNDQLDSLRYNLKQDKALDRVLDHANVVDKPADASEEPEASGE